MQVWVQLLRLCLDSCSSSLTVVSHVQVKTLKSGEIDYDHFRELLISNRAWPAIVNVNCGTTVKGAVDDLDKVLEILQECGYTEDRFYIHVDGALFGMMVSILPSALFAAVFLLECRNGLCSQS